MSSITEGFHSSVDKVKVWWQEFDLKALSEKIGGSSAEAIQAAIFFGVAFISGFLFKKYFKFLFTVLIIVVVTMKIMEYNQFLTFNWDAMREACGIEMPLDVNNVMKLCFAWVKQNVLLTIAAAIGFLVGFKLG